MLCSNSTRRPRAAWLWAAALAAAVLLDAATAKAQPPSARAAPAPAPPAGAPWLMSSEGGMPWQVAAMFTGFWVLMAAEIAIVSKPSGRLDKPKKKDEYQEAE